MTVPLWFVVDDCTRRWLEECAWCELPPRTGVLGAGRVYVDAQAAEGFATYAADALRTPVALVRADVQAAWAERGDVAACLREATWEWVAPYELRTANEPPTAAQWRDLAANVVLPLQLVRSVVPSPLPPPEVRPPVDWTRERGLGNSDCIASAELVRAPVDAVVDVLAANASTVVRDVFGKCVRYTERHRLVFRLRGHAWTCLVTCRGVFPPALDEDLLSTRLAAPVFVCRVSDSSGDASICSTENGVIESCRATPTEDGSPLRVRFRGREFTGCPFQLLHWILRSEDAWWEPYLRVNHFLDWSDWERPVEGAELQFAPALCYQGDELPVEASAWIAW
ncbi:MAG TPA: hypothetical protein VF384_05510 [Planctomycetota bacterium]